MKLTEYTVKKSLLRKVTQKTITGGYNSDENGAEVILTFTPGTQWVAGNGTTVEMEGEIDTAKANQMAQDEVRRVLNYQDGADVIDQVTSEGK